MYAPKTPERGSDGPSESGQGGSLASTLMEELLLIGLLVLLVGSIFTDAYYDVFGIQHQFLQLPTSYYVYRGLTALVNYPWLATPYILSAIIMMAIQGQPSMSAPPRKRWQLRALLWRERLLRHRKKLLYLSTLVLAGTAILLAQLAGQLKAQKDLVHGTSTLPAVVDIKIADEPRRSGWIVESEPKLRLLYTGTHYTVLFVPTTADSDTEARTPLTLFIANEKLTLFKTDCRTHKEEPREVSTR